MKKIEDHENYLQVHYSEPYQLDTFIALIKEVAETCRAMNCTKVLIDIRRMSGKVGTMDRFQIGVAGAEAFRGLAKVAVLYRREEINQFAENVSVNRGANVKGFSNLDKALKWLDVST